MRSRTARNLKRLDVRRETTVKVVFNLWGVEAPLRDLLGIGARVEFVEQGGIFARRELALTLLHPREPLIGNRARELRD